MGLHLWKAFQQTCSVKPTSDFNFVGVAARGAISEVEGTAGRMHDETAPSYLRYGVGEDGSVNGSFNPSERDTCDCNERKIGHTESAGTVVKHATLQGPPAGVTR